MSRDYGQDETHRAKVSGKCPAIQSPVQSRRTWGGITSCLDAEWGPIRHIRVIKERRSGISRGFAFVDFPSVGAAQTMMDRFGHEGLLVYDSEFFFEYRYMP
ncbi:hypothetical protein OROMI_013388 [Orobanche minor]